MANSDRRHDRFLKQLNNLRIWCGKQSHAKIASVTGRFKDLYPQNEVIKKLPELSSSTIGAVLRGERGVPRLGVVDAYVMACRYLRWKEHESGPQPDEKVLREWRDEYYLAYSDLDAPIPQAPVSDIVTPDFPPYDVGELAGVEPTPVVESPKRDAAPPLPTDDEREYVLKYGAAGKILLDGIMRGSSTACYQMAVLLATEHGRTDGAVELIRYAASGYDGEAANLLGRLGDLDDPQALARYADMIAETTNDLPIINMFRERAHACRNRPARPGPPATS